MEKNLKKEEYIEKIRKIVFSNIKNYYCVLNSKANRYLADFIKENTPLLNDPKYSFRTRVTWILNGLADFPKCRVCGKEIHSNLIVTHPIPVVCSQICSNRSSEKILKIHKAKEEHFGDPNFNNIAKCKETKLRKYGNENYNNSEKNIETFNKHKAESSKFLTNITSRRKNTILERYGYECCLHNPVIKEKIRKTCLEKYGVEHPMKNMEVQAKMKKTCLEKYGVENSFQSEICRKKARKTKLEKYGSETYVNVEQFRETYNKHKEEIPNFLKNIQEKIITTTLERYGVERYSELAEHKKYMSDLMSSSQMQKRICQIKKNNHTFNTSKSEEKCYQLLKEKFPSVIRQYRSEQYPFNCDFYIPEKDLYIEFNGTWLHGSHPFNENNEEDIEKLNTLLEKGKEKKFYLVAADTWSRRDVLKRKTVRSNNLNFLEFWNIEEVKKWLENNNNNSYEKNT